MLPYGMHSAHAAVRRRTRRAEFKALAVRPLGRATAAGDTVLGHKCGADISLISAPHLCTAQATRKPRTALAMEMAASTTDGSVTFRASR